MTAQPSLPGIKDPERPEQARHRTAVRVAAPRWAALVGALVLGGALVGWRDAVKRAAELRADLAEVDAKYASASQGRARCEGKTEWIDRWVVATFEDGRRPGGAGGGIGPVGGKR